MKAWFAFALVLLFAAGTASAQTRWSLATGYSADAPDLVQGAVLVRKPYTVGQITATAARLGVPSAPLAT